jgi:hypothetical protein
LVAVEPPVKPPATRTLVVLSAVAVSLLMAVVSVSCDQVLWAVS